jgi:hypothetical protein
LRKNRSNPNVKRLFIAIGLTIIVAVAGCSGTSKSDSDVQSRVSTAMTNPQNQAALQAAQGKVASCLPKGNLLTKDGRQKILDCVAPADQQQAFKTCVLNAAAKEHMATKEGRRLWRDQDLPNCLIKVQKGK